MPAIIRPADHGSEAWNCDFPKVTSPEILLQKTITDDAGKPSIRIKGMVQSSFPSKDFSAAGDVYAFKNGFVRSVMHAYNYHHRLIIRPEDVWFAILSQLSIYVNANAEELRHRFVRHEGQMELFINLPDVSTADHGEVAVLMTKFMNDFIVDQRLREWIMPTFTTTTKTDQTIAAVMFMGTMKKYFAYSWGTRCGIPEVVLEGEISDWVDIRQRVDRITEFFGKGSKGFQDVIVPAVDGIAKGFIDPEKTGRRHWQKVCVKHLPNGSGMTTYTGWITAFCYWNEDGKCLHPSSGIFGSRDVHLCGSDIPVGFVKVPVTLDWWGDLQPCEMIAGSIGIRAEDSSQSRRPDTIRPETGWFFYRI